MSGKALAVGFPANPAQPGTGSYSAIPLSGYSNTRTLAACGALRVPPGRQLAYELHQLGRLVPPVVLSLYRSADKLISVVPNFPVAEVVRLRRVAKMPEFSRIRLPGPMKLGTTEC